MGNKSQQKDLYEVLGLSSSATKDEINKAWKKKLSNFHPDKPASLENIKKTTPRNATETDEQYKARLIKKLDDIVKTINEAKDVLTDDSKRRDYDLKRKKASNGAQGSSKNSSSQNQSSSQGKTRFADGYYSGDLDPQGNPHGYGRMEFDSGDVYEGDYVGGEFHGKGKIFFTNGEIYEGDFSNNSAEGQGKYTIPNDGVYEGAFKNWKFCGLGKKTWNDGTIYEGYWQNDEPSGLGTKTYPNGTVESGQWTAGIFQGSPSNNNYGPQNQGGQSYNQGGHAAGASGGGNGNGAGTHNPHSGSGSNPISSAHDFSFRPFIFSDFTAFMTRGYGLKNGELYQNNDFLGMFPSSSKKLPLNQMGTPHHSGGWLTGTAHFPGLMGAPGIRWDNVVFPKGHADRIEKIKNGVDVPKSPVTANRVVAAMFAGALSFVFWGAANDEPDYTPRAPVKTVEASPKETNVRTPSVSEIKPEAPKEKTTPSAPRDEIDDAKSFDYGTKAYANGEYKGSFRYGKRHGRGTHTFNGGSTYKGKWKDDKWHGEGTYIDIMGNKYEGEYLEGYESGKGILISKNGEQYDGEFLKGRKHGEGIYSWPNGTRYEGEFKRDRPDGYGTYVGVNGQVYQGIWNEGCFSRDGQKFQITLPGQSINCEQLASQNQDEGSEKAQSRKYDYGEYAGDIIEGKRHGQGRFEFLDTVPSNSTYIGEWVDDKISGQGILRWQNGDQYAGNWLQGLPQGQGIYTRSDTEIQGDWNEGCLKSGQETICITPPTPKCEYNGYHYELNVCFGTNEYKNGRFEGVFVDQTRQGQGQFKYKGGDQYDGQWANNLREGYGTYSWKAKTRSSPSPRYTGEWLKGEIHGEGQLQFDYREYYDGQWVSGKPEGIGKYVKLNQILRGVWQGGCLVNGPVEKCIIRPELQAEDIAQSPEKELPPKEAPKEALPKEPASKEPATKEVGHSSSATNQSASESRPNQSAPNQVITKRYDEGTYTGTFVDGKRSGKGTFVWFTGERYEGDFMNDQRHGKGTFTDNKGLQYSGEWKNSEATGEGVMKFPNGNKYTGLFENGRETFGEMIYFSGLKYKGGWKDDMHHGQGEETLVNGERYVGNFAYGHRSGYGVRTTIEGEKYTGNWAFGKPDGNGVQTFPNGDEYKGLFEKGRKTSGIMTYANGLIYEGSWVDDMRHGQGTLTWPNGDQYRGNFAKGYRDGEGVFTAKDGKQYIGTWAHGKPNGEGTYIAQNGQKYSGVWTAGCYQKGRLQVAFSTSIKACGFENEARSVDRPAVRPEPTPEIITKEYKSSTYTGSFFNGKRHGEGTLTFNNGAQYSGNWRNGKPHGRGVYKTETGRKHSGRWKDGCYKSREFQFTIATTAEACGFN